MREHEKEIEELGLSVVVVTFETAEMAAAYVNETGLPWALLVDTPREVYRAFEISRGDWWAIWGPKSWGVYLRLLRKGRRLRRPTGDIYQLGGDVIVDPAGRVVFHRVGEGPADRPLISELLTAVRGADIR